MRCRRTECTVLIQLFLFSAGFMSLYPQNTMEDERRIKIKTETAFTTLLPQVIYRDIPYHKLQA